jgi:guanylate kinase
MTNQNTQKRGTLFVMSAPSGAGKSTLKDRMIEKVPGLRYSISCTTRNPRIGEVDGVHYFFKTKEEFLQMIEKNELVEHMEVHGNYYGTPKFFIEDCLSAGQSIVFDLDVYGKINFDKIYPDAVGILILCPSFEELERRIRYRATDSEEVIQLRMKNARDEVAFAQTQGKYEHTLINDDLERATAELLALMS